MVESLVRCWKNEKRGRQMAYAADRVPVSPFVGLIQGASNAAVQGAWAQGAIKMFGAYSEKPYATSMIVAIQSLRVATASESLMMIAGVSRFKI
jgi:hypothetical protein